VSRKADPGAGPAAGRRDLPGGKPVFPWLTTFDNIEFPLSLRRASSAAAARKRC
jgi:ABC-type nitrate/sulfonate/bicarbonate transport system ATPase subunit